MSDQMLTTKQARALLTFARRSGHQWRSKLRNLWVNDRIQRTDERREEAATLQQVRNQLGPGFTWLNKLTLREVELLAFPPLVDKQLAKPGSTFDDLYCGRFQTHRTSAGHVTLTCEGRGSILIGPGELDQLVSLLCLAKESGHVS